MAEGLIAAVRSGSLPVLERMLESDRCREEINGLSATGTTALHHAVWENRPGAVAVLLRADACPDLADEESGWTPLHSALYYLHLRCAALLLGAGGDLNARDFRGRTPLDLLPSFPLCEGGYEDELRLSRTRRNVASKFSLDDVVHDEEQDAEMNNNKNSASFASIGSQHIPPRGATVRAWGQGANYTLGTGSVGLQSTPATVEALSCQRVTALGAGKFHSVALTARGEVLTWGWGRGGRLGLAEGHIHHGGSAVIRPQRVLLSGVRIRAIAAGKHHTLLAGESGEVLAMGSNRHGQLGLPGQDTVPTPRRITALRMLRIVSVAAANKHSVALTDRGDVYTWGANDKGQLGYGESTSGGLNAPRIVESMRARHVVAVSASKRHTLALTGEGDVWSWGHRRVSPARVTLCAPPSAAQLHFHRARGEATRPNVRAIAAGTAHSTAITAAGRALSWRSADPSLRAQEVRGELAAHPVVAVSAGKYRTAVVTASGAVFCWEGRADYFPRKSAEEDRTKLGVGGLGGMGTLEPKHGVPVPERRSSGGGFALNSNMNVSRSLLGTSPMGGSPHAACSSSSASQRRGGLLLDRYARGRQARPLGSSPGGSSPHGLAVISTHANNHGLDDIVPERMRGMHMATAVAVGEKHTLALQAWKAADIPFDNDDDDDSIEQGRYRQREEEPKVESEMSTEVTAGVLSQGPRPLQEMAEAVVAQLITRPSNALRTLGVADCIGARVLERLAAAVALGAMSSALADDERHGLACLPQHALTRLERVAKKAAVEYAHKKGSIPTRWTTQLASSSLDTTEQELAPAASSRPATGSSPPGFTATEDALEQAVRTKLVKTLSKKLQQIETLRSRFDAGEALDLQQLAKLRSGACHEAAWAAMEAGAPTDQVQLILKAGEANEVGRSMMDEDPLCESSLARSDKGKAPLWEMDEGEPSSARKGARRKKKGQHGLASIPLEEAAGGPCSSSASLVDANAPSLVHIGFDAPLSDPEGGKRGRTSEEAPLSKDPSVTTPQSKSTGRKGGLSMFLKGQLDNPKVVPATTSTGPAWGGAGMIKPSTESSNTTIEAPSLRRPEHKAVARQEGSPSGLVRALTSQNSSSVQTTALGAVSATLSSSGSRGSQKSVSLSAFLKPTTAPWATPAADDASTAGKGARPSAARPSGEDRRPSMQQIMEEQEELRRQQRPGGRKDPRPSGRWYVPDEARPLVRSLAAIQTEECAMRELKKLYGSGNVKMAAK